MRARGIVIVSLVLLAACSAANPPAEVEVANGTTEPRDRGGEAPDATTEASAEAAAEDASDAGADAFDGFYPPPPSQCNPDLAIGAAVATREDARFAGVTRDERTIAWTAPNPSGKTSLFVAERNDADAAFGAPVELSDDAASDGVAIADDGLTLYGVSADHRRFVVYERLDRADDFVAAESSIFAPVIEALEPDEHIGDPVFVKSGLVLLYSVHGKSPDTMRMANRISIYASFFPAYTLAFDAFRAEGASHRRPTGTGEDFQVIFYWDEVSKTEKLARLNGTEAILGIKDLGAHPWAQANAGCTRIYFGNDRVLSADSR